MVLLGLVFGVSCVCLGFFVDLLGFVSTTLCSEKTPTNVFDYNSGVSGRFLYFFYQWKQEEIPYNLIIYSFDDVINASHCTSQKFTS